MIGFEVKAALTEQFTETVTWLESSVSSKPTPYLCKPCNLVEMSVNENQKTIRRLSKCDISFNIFLPADHPYNENHTPDSSFPLDPLDESEICTTVNYFPPGSVIASKGIKVTRLSDDPVRMTFRSSERRGGFMVLPEGATRQEISRAATRVFNHVRHNAVQWARYFAQRHGRTTANGSTYFITGVDKTSVCANLAFPSRPPTVKMSATYQDQLIDATERMSNVNNASDRRANRGLSPLPKNLCVFMRGIRIGLSRTGWLENGDERREADTPYSEIFFDAPRLTLFNRVWGKDEQALPQNHKSFFARHAFHPSDIVAQIMLCMLLSPRPSHWIFFSGFRRCNCGSGR